MFGILTSLFGGKQPPVGTKLDIKTQLIGRAALVTVRTDEKGYKRVEAVTPQGLEIGGGPFPAYRSFVQADAIDWSGRTGLEYVVYNRSSVSVSVTGASNTLYSSGAAATTVTVTAKAKALDKCLLLWRILQNNLRRAEREWMDFALCLSKCVPTYPEVKCQTLMICTNI
jgi:hypothetical protein